MGFGGINVHCVLSSHGAPSPRLAPRLPVPAMLASSQRSELFVISAGSAEQLAAQVAALRRFVGGLAYCELPDLAADLGRHCAPGQQWRLALVASTPFELEAILDDTAKRLASTAPLAPGERRAQGNPW